MLSIIALSFPASNVQTNSSKNILQKNGNNLHSFALIFHILVIWQFNTFCTPAFLSVIFAMVLTLIFILSIALIFNIYVKLTCIFLSFSCVLFLGFFLFSRLAGFFLWRLYCFCVILLIFYTFLVCFLLTVTIIIYH